MFAKRAFRGEGTDHSNDLFEYPVDVPCMFALTEYDHHEGSFNTKVDERSLKASAVKAPLAKGPLSTLCRCPLLVHPDGM